MLETHHTVHLTAVMLLPANRLCLNVVLLYQVKELSFSIAKKQITIRTFTGCHMASGKRQGCYHKQPGPEIDHVAEAEYKQCTDRVELHGSSALEQLRPMM